MKKKKTTIEANLPVMDICRVEAHYSTEMMWVSSVLDRECTAVEDDGSAIVVLGLQVGKIQEVKSLMASVPILWGVPEALTLQNGPDGSINTT